MFKKKVSNFFRFIRFSHTIFALPFALGSAFVAAKDIPNAKVLGLIILAMIFARSAAMLFNRLADWEIDKKNPRTVDRSLLVDKKNAWLALFFTSAAFVLTTWFINTVCFYLSPLALAVIFGYSLTKRFFYGAQFVLGFALSIAPLGAWLAVRGELEISIFLLAIAVLFWVAGFDTIYATLDFEFDKENDLKSLVTFLGIAGAQKLAIFAHFLAWVLLIVWGKIIDLGTSYFLIMILNLGILIYEHFSAKKGDRLSINRAFFISNGSFSLLWLVGVMFSVLCS